MSASTVKPVSGSGGDSHLCPTEPRLTPSTTNTTLEHCSPASLGLQVSVLIRVHCNKATQKVVHKRVGWEWRGLQGQWWSFQCGVKLVQVNNAVIG